MIGKNSRQNFLCGSSLVAAAITLSGGNVQAQTQAPATASQSERAEPQSGGIQDIIVTAQKRSESANSVPMSITAASGDTLLQRGVSTPADLEKIVPGFTFANSQYSTPIYLLRGIGFYETSLASAPAVSVYVDEVPLPVPMLTKGAGLDVARVEVLKGPQGTLFGQNSTGGAVNYIAAKPTEDLKMGFDGSYARFNLVEVGGFVSGPVSDTLGIRVSAKTSQGGAWQYDTTRDAKNGNQNFTLARVLFDWKPSDGVNFVLNLNRWVEKSDAQSAQILKIIPRVVPGAVDPTPPQIKALVPPGDKIRASAWNPGFALERDEKFYQASLRGDIDLSDSITLTTISNYAKYKQDDHANFDGTVLEEGDADLNGDYEVLSQELRLGGKMGNLTWILGGNYSHETSGETQIFYLSDSVSRLSFGFPTRGFRGVADQTANTYAAFGNVDLEIFPGTTIQGGLRYTDSRRNFVGCTRDSGDGNQAKGGEALQAILKAGTGRAVIPIPPGACYTLNAQADPAEARIQLNENNLSWRAAINHKFAGNTMIYASLSRGYKAGATPVLTAGLTGQYTAVTQETVLAYEAGVKAPLLGNMVQVNVALFYYDYTNKQLRGRGDLFPFRAVERLINVPKSSVTGVDLAIEWQPTSAFHLTAGGVYAKSKVLTYTGYTPDGVFTSFRGSPFPYTPKWQITADGQYDFPLGDTLEGFVGAGVTYHSATSASFVAPTPSVRNIYDLLKVPAYTLIDLRAGVNIDDGRWRVTGFVNNVTNKLYVNSVNQLNDLISRYTGMPRTFGVRVSYRM